MAVDLAALSVQQLSSVKKQLDNELEHLTNSFTELRAAQAKFRECLTSVSEDIASKTAGKTTRDETTSKAILVPLTSSLYVPGALADTDTVIVDVGTGFYVEKSTKNATDFYKRKIEELAISLKDLESIVQGKSNNLRVVEDVLRQKVISHGVSNAAVAT
ncbi:MAG: subunit of tubulin prefoldin [Pleopsidium flavum]|nr:MAG: subunit of tubulin prefoldin [Pleopsidium flavum]